MLIHEAAKSAVSNVRDFRSFTIEGPLEGELTTPMRRFGAESMQRGVRVLNSFSAMSFILP